MTSMNSDTHGEIVKIDIVYLWVDGSDPKFQSKRNYWRNRAGHLDKQVSAEGRWIDSNELKYSLRSLEKNAPWINRIYIIVDDQQPVWLTNHQKVTLVDVKELFPENILPIFNSMAIETRLPYIENLSEHFLYANDDMFFGAPLKPSFFFD